MPRIIHTTAINVTAMDVVRPYDQRSQILKDRRARLISKTTAKASWETAKTLTMVDRITQITLSRGVKTRNLKVEELKGGRKVSAANFIRLFRASDNDGHMDVSQQTVVNLLAKGKGLKPDTSVVSAVYTAALDIDRDQSGIVGMPNQMRDTRAIKTATLDDIDELYSTNGGIQDVEGKVSAEWLMSLMSDSEKLAIAKKLKGDALTSAEHNVIYRMRDRIAEAIRPIEDAVAVAQLNWRQVGTSTAEQAFMDSMDDMLEPTIKRTYKPATAGKRLHPEEFQRVPRGGFNKVKPLDVLEHTKQTLWDSRERAHEAGTAVRLGRTTRVAVAEDGALDFADIHTAPKAPKSPSRKQRIAAFWEEMTDAKSANTPGFEGLKEWARLRVMAQQLGLGYELGRQDTARMNEAYAQFKEQAIT